MNFAPKSDADLSTGNLLPKGEYDFEIVSAIDKVSKQNNEMIELKVLVYIDGTPARQIFDYLMESVAYKLKHFCYATGLNKKYDEGTLQAFDCNGVSGRCKIIIKEDKAGAYPPKNSIADYIVCEKPEKKTQQQSDMSDGSFSDFPF